MIRLIIASLAGMLCSPALAGVYMTDSTESAQVWIYITDSTNAADCSLWTGDIQQSHVGADIWAYRTPSTLAADKWVLITETRSLADDISCLLRD
jgi:hypothetical protein